MFKIFKIVVNTTYLIFSPQKEEPYIIFEDSLDLFGLSNLNELLFYSLVNLILIKFVTPTI